MANSLDCIGVIEFTRFQAGLRDGQMLSDLGAKVIQVE